MIFNKKKTPFFSTSARPQFYVALALAIVLAAGFVLGLSIPR